MKKNLFFAALVAALLSAPVIDASASSGFSSTKGGSSSKPSSDKASSKADTRSTKRDSAPAPSAARASSSVRKDPAPASARPDYGRTSVLTQPKPPATNFAPANKVTPQLKEKGSAFAAIAAAAPAPAPTKSGFTSDAGSSTKKKLAGVAGATVLGGALYAASANHDAVAAYEEAQRPAPAPAPAKVEPSRPIPETRVAAAAVPAQSDPRKVVTQPAPPPAPQVIVVRERSYPREDATYAAERAYREGVRDAQRQSRNTTATYPEPSAQVMPRATQSESAPFAVQQPRQAPMANPQAESTSGVAIFIVAILVLGVLGVLAFIGMRASTSRKTAMPAKQAARKPNYTL